MVLPDPWKEVLIHLRCMNHHIKLLQLRREAPFCSPFELAKAEGRSQACREITELISPEKKI